MEKKKRQKRSHAEVVAAREAYAKERHDREVAKEAKKAEREKLLAEREERRKLREARKNMTSEELRNSRMEEKIKKSKKSSRFVENDVIHKIRRYEGELRPGDTVKAFFAGCPVVGELTEIEYSEDEESRAKYNVYTILVKDSGPYSGMKCFVRREKIIAKYN